MARKQHAGEFSPASVPDDANNVLVMASTHTGNAKDICTELLTRDRLAETFILAVTYSWGADVFRKQLCETVEHPPEHLAVVGTRTQYDQFANDRSQEEYPLTVRNESPEDLTGLGIQTTEFLTRWHDVEKPVAVCFESLTALLQHVPLKRAYRFLHIFTRRVRQADATAHYHMMPGAHDDQTVETLKQLFDAVVVYHEDAQEYEIRTR